VGRRARDYYYLILLIEEDYNNNVSGGYEGPSIRPGVLRKKGLEKF
jgi:hypothetical protein